MTISQVRKSSLEELAAFAPPDVARKADCICRTSSPRQVARLAVEIASWADRRGTPLAGLLAGEARQAAFVATKAIARA